MAEVIGRVCDLTGETDATARVVVVDGVRYEIDLALAESAKLDSALAPFLSVARKVTTRSQMLIEAKAIRAWAVDNYEGHTRSDGRLPVALRAAWVAAGSPVNED